MGTPEFAVASLDALVNAGCRIVAVITAPDKPAGRGMQLQQSPVKKYALEHSLPVLQPEKLKDPAFLETLRGLQADLQVVVAFRMLPEQVWNMPPMGTINIHGSLLPQYRGAAPINWAVMNGEKMTGVTSFRLQHEIDTGDILLQESFPIEEEDTAGTVHDRMKEIGAQLLVKTIQGIADGSLQQRSQQHLLPADPTVKLHHAPKIHTDTCRINWSQPLEKVYNHIRGLSPYPGAFLVINEKMMKVFRAKKEPCFPSHTEGDYATDGKTFLKFACSDGYMHLLEIQMEGKKKMSIEEFLRGYRSPGDNGKK